MNLFIDFSMTKFVFKVILCLKMSLNTCSTKHLQKQNTGKRYRQHVLVYGLVVNATGYDQKHSSL